MLSLTVVLVKTPLAIGGEVASARIVVSAAARVAEDEGRRLPTRTITGVNTPLVSPACLSPPGVADPDDNRWKHDPCFRWLPLALGTPECELEEAVAAKP